MVAYALAGTVDIDFNTTPLGKGKDGKDVYLKDIWPSREEVSKISSSVVKPAQFRKVYDTILDGNEMWKKL